MKKAGGKRAHPNFSGIWREDDPAIVQLRLLWEAEALLDRDTQHLDTVQVSGFLALAAQHYEVVYEAYSEPPTAHALAQEVLLEAATEMPDISADTGHNPIEVTSNLQALYQVRQARLPGVLALLEAQSRQN